MVEEGHFELIREKFERTTVTRLTDVWSGARLTVVNEAIDECRWRSGLVSI